MKLWVAVALLAGATATAHAQTAAQDVSGEFANGTAYNIHVPAGWDGSALLLNADLPDNNNEIYRWLHQRGYATVGESRRVTDWQVAAGSNDVIELKELFVSKFRQPATTILWGASLGGLVTRDAIEAYPRAFQGAVPMCGGGAGMVGMWNNRLDAVFALKTLVAPDDRAFEIVSVTDEAQAIAALRAAVAHARTTPAGRARLALVAAVVQIDAWPTGMAAHPADDDVDAQLGALESAYNAMLFSRAAIETAANGNISWNVGVRYAEMFDMTGARSSALVERLYRAAGLTIADDLRTLDRAVRIQADEQAVAWAIENGTHTGAFEIPVLSVFTAVDPRAALSEFNAYERTVRAAGTGALSRQVGVDSSGHCAFRPAALNARAARLNESSDDLLGAAARFAPFEGVVAFPRPFTVGHDRAPAGAIKTAN